MNLGADMRFGAREILTAGLVLTLGLTSSCSQDSNSAKVDIKVAPTNPIVIDSDLKLTTSAGDEVTISAPWFLATFTVENSSEKVLSVIAIRMISSGTLSGAPSTKEVEYTQDEEVNSNGEVTLGQLFYVNPGETATFAGYFDGHADTDNDAFSVRATFIGWFSDPGTPNPEDNRLNPNERFERNLSFYAR